MDQADISGNGLSEWLRVDRGGGTVFVDCLDENGESTDWNGASVGLIFSPDKKMKAYINAGTSGFFHPLPNYGNVAIKVSNYQSGTFRIAVVD